MSDDSTISLDTRLEIDRTHAELNYRGMRTVFYKCGDKHDPGTAVVLSRKQFKHWIPFLDFLTKKLDMLTPIHKIYSTDGREIKNFDGFDSGGQYVAVTQGNFVQMEYGTQGTFLDDKKWNSDTKVEINEIGGLDSAESIEIYLKKCGYKSITGLPYPLDGFQLNLISANCHYDALSPLPSTAKSTTSTVIYREIMNEQKSGTVNVDRNLPEMNDKPDYTDHQKNNMKLVMNYNGKQKIAGKSAQKTKESEIHRDLDENRQFRRRSKSHSAGFTDTCTANAPKRKSISSAPVTARKINTTSTFTKQIMNYPKTEIKTNKENVFIIKDSDSEKDRKKVLHNTSPMSEMNLVTNGLPIKMLETTQQKGTELMPSIISEEKVNHVEGDDALNTTETIPKSKAEILEEKLMSTDVEQEKVTKEKSHQLKQDLNFGNNTSRKSSVSTTGQSKIPYPPLHKVKRNEDNLDASKKGPSRNTTRNAFIQRDTAILRKSLEFDEEIPCRSKQVEGDNKRRYIPAPTREAKTGVVNPLAKPHSSVVNVSGIPKNLNRQQEARNEIISALTRPRLSVGSIPRNVERNFVCDEANPKSILINKEITTKNIGRSLTHGTSTNDAIRETKKVINDDTANTVFHKKSVKLSSDSTVDSLEKYHKKMPKTVSDEVSNSSTNDNDLSYITNNNINDNNNNNTDNSFDSDARNMKFDADIDTDTETVISVRQSAIKKDSKERKTKTKPVRFDLNFRVIPSSRSGRPSPRIRFDPDLPLQTNFTQSEPAISKNYVDYDGDLAPKKFRPIHYDPDFLEFDYFSY